jgi:hypothetical protein
LSLYTGYRIALTGQAGQGGRSLTAWKAFAPWGLLTLLLFASGVWIVLQPMQMRGTMADDGTVQVAEVEL